MNNTDEIIPPICLSTIFNMHMPFTNKQLQYGRIENPTRTNLEKTLARLEDAKWCTVFSSGSSAIATFLLTIHPGNTVICHSVMYEGTFRLFEEVFRQLNIRCIRIDMHNLKLVASTMTEKSTWIFLESPTNPFLETFDIRSLSHIAHAHHMRIAVDNTLASPAVQKPLTLGADIVIESLSKSINGHSDVIGGLVATNDMLLHKKLRYLQQTVGAILSPFDCFLVQRGLKTFDMRMTIQEQSAKAIAFFLAKHKNVEKIHFPGQGSVLSFHIKKSVNPTIFLKRLTFIKIAQSFGGLETLIQQPTQMMDLSFSAAERTKLSIDDWLFRLSVGAERTQDIINDLQNALK